MTPQRIRAALAMGSVLTVAKILAELGCDIRPEEWQEWCERNALARLASEGILRPVRDADGTWLDPDSLETLASTLRLAYATLN